VDGGGRWGGGGWGSWGGEGRGSAVAVPAQDVQIDRQVEILRGGPELVVVRRGKRQLCGRYLPDDRAAHAGFAAALQLFDGAADVLHRQHGDPDQPVRPGATVSDKPIGVDTRANP